MSDFQNATVHVGYAGLNGTGVTEGEKTTINSRLTALEALTPPTVIDDLTDVDTTTNAPATGDLLEFDGTNWVPYTPSAISVATAATFLIDGGGAVITSGVKGDLVIPFSATITAHTALADQSGTISVGIWKDAIANYPPVVGDLVLTVALAAGAVNGPVGASVAVNAGDVLRFNVTSTATSITRLSIVLTMIRSVGP